MANPTPNGPLGRPEKAPWWNPGKYFDVRRRTPIEQRSYTKLYSLLAIALFLFTLWAVLDEVLTRRPWKDVQADFKEFKTARLTLMIKREIKKLNPDDTMKLHKQIRAVQKQMNSDSYQKSLDRINDLDKEIVTANRDYTFTKSNADEAYYLLDEARTEHKDTTGKSKTLRGLEATMASQQRVVDSLEKLRSAEEAKIIPIQKEQKALESTHDSIFAPVIALRRKLDAVEKMPVAVKQTMLVNYDKTNFNNLKMRVDRCVTCHLGYDDALFKNDTLVTTDAKQIKQWKKDNKYNDSHYTVKTLGPNKDTVVAMVAPVFRMHPKIDLLIKGHKVGEPSGPGVLGCTSCHGGQGASLVSAEFAHGLEHHWTEPLLTGRYVESSCQNCHAGKMDFEDAKWISKGKKLFTDFGCYGCHNAPGYDGMPNQAPSLLNVAMKDDPNWIYQWIKNPRGWAHNTRMPNFMFSDHEATAVTAYIVDQSKSGTYLPIAKFGGGGDAANGKAVFGSVGCVACHSIDEWRSESRVKEFNTFGPDLQKVGSKVTAEWLYDWIKNPKNYHAQTRMPSLRLSDGEAADITAYLMQHKGVNDSVHSTLSGDITSASLIKEGEGLIRSYGCFGCHTIKGMEKESKVSVALSTFAKKGPNELFFGNVAGRTLHNFREDFKKEGMPLGLVDEHMIHEDQDWYTWVIGKMKNSRMYQTERIAQKMPNFQMSNDEAYALSIWLKTMTGNYVSPSYADALNEPVQMGLTQGRMFAHWNNCVACHVIEKEGGYIARFIEDPMYRPPLLTPEGNKVQEVWLRSFLRGPTPIRPWLKIRMPTFGFSDSSIGVATKYFLATQKRPFVLTDYTLTLDQSLIPSGKQLFDNLKCLSCHVTGTAGGAQQIAPNLDLTRRRLRPEWVIDWLHNPEAQQPGTRMPAFWGTPKTGMNTMFPALLGADPELQIRAVRDYVYSFGSTTDITPTPYAVISGTDHYVLPNGQYDVVLTNAMPASMSGATVAAPTSTTTSPSTPAATKEPAKKASVPRAGKPTALK